MTTDLIADIKIFTDGSCINHAGMGAWSYVKTQNGEVLGEKWGHEENTTHIRMELTAVYFAVRDLADGVSAIILTDSKYIVDAINEKKLQRWLETDFKTKKGKRSHADLWSMLAYELEQKTITFRFVPSHSGITFNDRADRLARRCARDAVPCRSETSNSLA